jgi:hypothetical protein
LLLVAGLTYYWLRVSVVTGCGSHFLWVAGLTWYWLRVSHSCGCGSHLRLRVTHFNFFLRQRFFLVHSEYNNSNTARNPCRGFGKNILLVLKSGGADKILPLASATRGAPGPQRSEPGITYPRRQWHNSNRNTGEASLLWRHRDGRFSSHLPTPRPGRKITPTSGTTRPARDSSGTQDSVVRRRPATSPLTPHGTGNHRTETGSSHATRSKPATVNSARGHRRL